MKIKPLYLLLALPVLLFVLYFAVVPGVTRDAFIIDFKHRIGAMFGYEPPPIGGEEGLRIERPEEYGMVEADPDIESGDGEAGPTEDDTADESPDDATETAEQDADEQDADEQDADEPNPAEQDAAE